MKKDRKRISRYNKNTKAIIISCNDKENVTLYYCRNQSRNEKVEMKWI